MGLSFRDEKSNNTFVLLGYKITFADQGQDYAQVILGSKIVPKDREIAAGMTASTYFIPVNIVKQFTDDLIGSDCNAVISSYVSNGRNYKNVIEISFN